MLPQGACRDTEALLQQLARAFGQGEDEAVQDTIKRLLRRVAFSANPGWLQALAQRLLQSGAVPKWAEMGSLLEALSYDVAAARQLLRLLNVALPRVLLHDLDMALVGGGGQWVVAWWVVAWRVVAWRVGAWRVERGAASTAGPVAVRGLRS